MNIAVFGLVFASASIHVLWNTLVKQSTDKVSFAWLTSVLGALFFLPVFLSYRLLNPGPLPSTVWGWAALSGFFEAGYVVLLFAAYKKTDLSVVYPLSRGIAPVVTLLLGGRMLGDWVAYPGLASVLVVVAGVSLVGLSAWLNPSLGDRNLSGILLALATGFCIAGYHLVDRQAMSMPDAPNPPEYLFLMQCFLLFFVTVWAVFRTRASRSLFSEWKNNLRSVLIVGFGTPIAYFLIVLALKFGNVTYIAAGRNVGIFLSTLVGAIFLKERVTRLRLMGVILIVTGVIALVVCQEC